MPSLQKWNGCCLGQTPPVAVVFRPSPQSETNRSEKNCPPSTKQPPSSSGLLDVLEEPPQARRSPELSRIMGALAPGIQKVCLRSRSVGTAVAASRRFEPSTATATAASRTAALAFACLVAGDRSIAEIRPVQTGQRRSGFLRIRHFHEAESSRPIRFAIHHDGRSGNFPVTAKSFAKFAFRRLERQISNINIRH
jgi:hypothetical protein